MGCKPSKNSQSQVAINSTVSSQSLQKEESATSAKANIEEVANTMPNCEDEEREDHATERVEVKEVHQSATDEEEEEGKAHCSPDSCLSSRMDGARFFSLEGEEVMALIEYLSDTEGPKIETEEMKKDVRVGVDEEEKKGEEEDGEPSNSGSIDLKETILVEETTAEKKNVTKEEEEEKGKKVKLSD